MESISRYALINGTIWTGEEDPEFAEAIIIKGEYIEFVGSTEEVLQRMLKGEEVINIFGRFVVPGFIDSHVHFFKGGESLCTLDVSSATSISSFLALLAKHSATLYPNEWLLGSKLNLRAFPEKLTRFHLDHLENPVCLRSYDGHSILVNSLALKIAGVTEKDLPEIEGGSFQLLEDGRLSGLIIDQACGLIEEHIPQPSAKQLGEWGKAAQEYFLGNGVTSVHHMSLFGSKLVGGLPLDLAQFRTFMEENELKVRVYCATYIEQAKELKELIDKGEAGEKTGMLRIGSIKGFVDGSLGSHSAYLFDCYSDLPTDHGLAFYSALELYSKFKLCDDLGLHLCIHGIGDLAISMILDAFEQIVKENGERDRRWRIEHSQHVREEDMQRFGKLGVIASVQPAHFINEGNIIEKYIGPARMKGTYAFKSLLSKGAKLALGSDWFVAPAEPLLALEAAVRRLCDGQVFLPAERLSVKEAILGHTLWAATAAHEEAVKGSLKEGKLADLVIIDKNLFEVEDISACNIMKTIVGGKVRFES